VLDPAARKHGPTRDALARLTRLARGEPTEPAPDRQSGDSPLIGVQRSEPAAEAPLAPAALALEERLRAAGHEPPSTADLGDDAEHLPALRTAGRAVRVGRDLHAHPEAIAAVRARLEALVQAEGPITLARLRDELGTSRRYAQALLEHFDATRVTLKLPGERRGLRGARRGAGTSVPPGR
jgi:selenocysteine-specific elongation factor